MYADCRTNVKTRRDCRDMYSLSDAKFIDFINLKKIPSHTSSTDVNDSDLNSALIDVLSQSQTRRLEGELLGAVAKLTVRLVILFSSPTRWSET